MCKLTTTDFQARVILLMTSLLAVWQPAQALGPSDLEQNLDLCTSVAKSSIKDSFIDALKAGPARFQDYKCCCRLYKKKDGVWKEVGGADLSFKYKDFFKAVIKTSDYRNGAVVALTPGGKVRGCGGGALRFMKMNLPIDSPTLRLPTGYNLVKSDFCSLYDSLKDSLYNGANGFSSQGAVNINLFDEPVTVLILKKPGTTEEVITELVLVNSKTSAPNIWTTFKDGRPYALVIFEDLQPNQGLQEGHFHL